MVDSRFSFTIARAVAPLVTWLVGRQFTKDFARLKRMMETGEL